MTPCLSEEEFRLFQTFIRQECGIVLGTEKTYLIEHRLAPLLREFGCSSYADFYLRAKHGGNSGLRDRIVDALTTSETSWCRDGWPFQALRDKLLPLWAEQLRGGSRSSLRIWSAACASGQEPYSILMTILEYARERQTPYLPEKTTLLATDIARAVLDKARAGRFHALELGRGLPPGFREHYFVKEEDSYAVRREVRRAIDFRAHNLQDPFDFGFFDLIFLRNVAIYFSRELKEILCARLERALRPGGCLFLGATESLAGIRHGLEKVSEGRITYYRRPSGTG